MDNCNAKRRPTTTLNVVGMSLIFRDHVTRAHEVSYIEPRAAEIWKATADILSFLIGLGFSVSDHDAQAEAPVSQPKLERAQPLASRHAGLNRQRLQFRNGHGCW
jgi:hypothetical protein